MIPQSLKKYARHLPSYAELRCQENRSRSLAMVNGDFVRNAGNSRCGVSARVFSRGSWGFASTPDIKPETIKQTIKNAAQNARYLSKLCQSKRKTLPGGKAGLKQDLSTGKQRKSDTAAVDFLKNIDAYIARKYKKLTSRTVVLSCLDMEKIMMNSQGAHAYSMIPRSIFFCNLSVTRKGEAVELHDIIGGAGQFEDVFTRPARLYAEIDETYAHLMKKAEGVHAVAGMKECIIAEGMVGIFAHEAIGHTAEADVVLGGSVAANYLGKQIASPLVSIVDFAHEAFGKPCPVPVKVDDEGTRASDAVMIDKGILKGYLHNKESARHFNAAPTGNARAYRFSDEPIIRMRNTAILPGRDRVADMIASIDDGYYLMKAKNGQADTTSEFMFGIDLGYEIRNGKLARAIRDTTVSGVAYDVLKTVTMAGNKMHWSSGGMCGKKQLIPVSFGGPAVKCKLQISR